MKFDDLIFRIEGGHFIILYIKLIERKIKIINPCELIIINTFLIFTEFSFYFCSSGLYLILLRKVQRVRYQPEQGSGPF